MPSNPSYDARQPANQPETIWPYAHNNLTYISNQWQSLETLCILQPNPKREKKNSKKEIKIVIMLFNFGLTSLQKKLKSCWHNVMAKHKSKWDIYMCTSIHMAQEITQTQPKLKTQHQK